MQVLVNINPLYPPLAGIGHYTARLAELMLQDPDIELIGIGPYIHYRQEQIQNLINQGYQQVTDAATVIPDRHRLSGCVSIEALRKLLRFLPYLRNIKQALTAHTAKRLSNTHPQAVYWEPNYILLPVNCPSLVTIHDLSHIRYAHCHPAARVKWIAKGLDKSLSYATGLVAVSEFTRQEVISTFGVDEKRISVISPAVGDEFFADYSVASLNLIKRKYQLPDQYILSVGTLEPRKNLLNLIRAYRLLPDKLRSDYPLVLVGTDGWGLNDFQQHAELLERKGELIRLGYVPQDDLPLLYRNALLLAYVSLYEGFGMPVAEAMASGTPVLTSNCSSMPEVANGAATLADPTDIDDIAEKLRTLIEDQTQRTLNVNRGIAVANHYRWHRSAQKLKSLLMSMQTH